ncbi:MAG: isoprenylcysteine carboxylmethyltransferase family protein [Phycisphaerae bacterium]|nr:isoprenylcysteine carboxylmethyltransferase family protein [Phycisphaerae bacterium]
MERLRFLRKSRVMILRIAFAPVIFIALFVWRSWEDHSIRDFAVEWSGYILLLAGISLRMWSTLYIGQRKSKKLITDGPFSMCRNPLYFGSLLMAIGIALCFENLILLIFVLVVLVPIHLLVILSEEEQLLKNFGTAYEEYKKQVPRLWFAFSRYQSPELIEVSTRAVRRATMEMILLLLIPPLGDLIETLHFNGVLPVLWRF